MSDDTPVGQVDPSLYSNDQGIMGSMSNTASQFGQLGSGVWNMANDYARSQGGWGNTLEHAASGYVSSHGGAANTAAHLGHEAFNVAANSLWGAKDWGKAYRAAKEGRWGDAAESAAWGLAAAGATASMVVPGAGAGIKAAELGAQAGRVAAREGVELAGKEGLELAGKEAGEAVARHEGEEAVAKGAVDETGEAVAKGKAKGIRRAEKVAHLGHELSGLHMPQVQLQGQQETYTRSF